MHCCMGGSGRPESQTRSAPRASAARQASIVRRRMDDMPMQLSALLAAAVGLGDDQTAQRAIRVEIERYVENLLRELAEESIADGS